MLMYSRRLNLSAVKFLVTHLQITLIGVTLKYIRRPQIRGGHIPNVVNLEGRGALWYATLPNRRGLGRNLGFNVLVSFFMDKEAYSFFVEILDNLTLGKTCKRRS